MGLNIGGESGGVLLIPLLMFGKNFLGGPRWVVIERVDSIAVRGGIIGAKGHGAPEGFQSIVETADVLHRDAEVVPG